MSRETVGPLVGLGQAYELCFLRAGASKPERVGFPADRWWGWDGSPSTGTLVLVHLQTSASRVPFGHARDMHTRFHGEEPSDGWIVSAPPVARPLRVIGLVISLAYDARGRSRTKGDKPYRHQFGDFGNGDVRTDDKYLPALAFDASDRLRVVRRPGNRYSLDDWLRG